MERFAFLINGTSYIYPCSIPLLCSIILLHLTWSFSHGSGLFYITYMGVFMGAKAPHPPQNIKRRKEKRGKILSSFPINISVIWGGGNISAGSVVIIYGLSVKFISLIPLALILPPPVWYLNTPLPDYFLNRTTHKKYPNFKKENINLNKTQKSVYY